MISRIRFKKSELINSSLGTINKSFAGISLVTHRSFAINKPFDDKEKADENRYIRDEEKRLLSDLKSRALIAHIVTKHKLTDTNKMKVMDNFDKIMKQEKGQKVKKSDILTLLSKSNDIAMEQEIISKLNY